MEKLIKITKDVRTKTDWGKTRTLNDSKPDLLSEIAELTFALKHYDKKNLEDELGNVLFSIVFLSEILEFDFYKIIDRIVDKMERRHPFIDDKDNNMTLQEEIAPWETLKKEGL